MYSFGVTLPRAGLFSDLITDAFIIAIIGFVINISQAKLLAKKNSYAVHPDQVRIHPILDYSYFKTLDISYWCQC
jgi:MFS superfamily sulfate permease-like transporter